MNPLLRGKISITVANTKKNVPQSNQSHSSIANNIVNLQPESKIIINANKKTNEQLAKEVINILINTHDQKIYSLNKIKISGIQLLKNIFNTIFILGQFGDASIPSDLKQEMLSKIPEINLYDNIEVTNLKKEMHAYGFRSALRFELLLKRNFLKNICTKDKNNSDEDLIFKTAFIDSLIDLLFIDNKSSKLIDPYLKYDKSYLESYFSHFNLSLNNEQIYTLIDIISKNIVQIYQKSFESNQIKGLINFLFKNPESIIVENVNGKQIIQSIILFIIKDNSNVKPESTDLCKTIPFNNNNFELSEILENPKKLNFFNTELMSMLNPELIKIYKDFEFKSGSYLEELNKTARAADKILKKFLYSIMSSKKLGNSYTNEDILGILKNLHLSDENIMYLKKYSNKCVSKITRNQLRREVVYYHTLWQLHV